jgi:hypothetical protein
MTGTYLSAADEDGTYLVVGRGGTGGVKKAGIAWLVRG